MIYLFVKKRKEKQHNEITITKATKIYLSKRLVDLMIVKNKEVKKGKKLIYDLSKKYKTKKITNVTHSQASRNI